MTTAITVKDADVRYLDAPWMEINSLLVYRSLLFIPCSNKLEATAGPGHACQKILMWECVRGDAEGRSSVVPLMVSAQELKCMPLIAWERVTVYATNCSHPPPSRKKKTKTRGWCLFQEGCKKKPSRCFHIQKDSGVRLPVWSLFSP